MKIIINAKKLAHALKISELILKEGAGRDFNSVNNHVRITAENDKVELVANSSGVGTTYSLLLEGTESLVEPGVITVDVAKLLQLATKEGDSNLTIEKTNDKFVSVSTKNSSVNLISTDGSKYPYIENVELEYYIDIPRNTLLNLIKQTQFCISTKSTYKPLLHLLLEVRRDSFSAVACDNSRIAVAEVKFENIFKDVEAVTKTLPDVIFGTNNTAQIQFSNKVCSIIKTAIEGSEIDTVRMYIQHSDEKILRALFNLGNSTITATLNRSSYPQYQETIPKTYIVEGEMNKADFESAIATASTIHSSNVTIQLEKGKKIQITTNNQQQEVSKTSLNGNVEGETTSIKLEISLLSKVISAIPSTDREKTEFTFKIGKVREAGAFLVEKYAFEDSMRIFYLQMPVGA